MKTLIVIALFLAVAPAALAQETAPPDNNTAAVDRRGLPTEVPNIYDPVVAASLRVIRETNLYGNEDFPLVVLLTTTGDPVIIGLDARNGKDTWSFKEDPVILIVHGPAVFVDNGFLAAGRASGSYSKVEDLPGVLDKLGERINALPVQHL